MEDTYYYGSFKAVQKKVHVMSIEPELPCPRMSCFDRLQWSLQCWIKSLRATYKYVYTKFQCGGVFTLKSLMVFDLTAQCNVTKWKLKTIRIIAGSLKDVWYLDAAA